MSQGRSISGALLALAAITVCLCALFPFYWAIVSSLKTGSELFKVDFIPKHPTLANYAQAFVNQRFGLNLLNSVIVAFTTVAFSCVLGILASYALARHRFKGRVRILQAFLLVSMFPQIAVLSGLFELIRAVGLFNQRAGLISAYLILTLPFTVWTLTAFMRDIPREVEEAAMLDGASQMGILVRIIVPLMAPSIVPTALLAFIAAWNEFLFALTFTVTDRSRTVPVAIALMSGASAHEVPWGMIMAASVSVTLPVIALVLFFQRKIVSGLTAGSVKG